MDKKQFEVWEDFLTAVEKSTRKKETRLQFLSRIEGEGYSISVPVSNTQSLQLKITFCDEAYKSRKSREPIKEFVERMEPTGYKVEYKIPTVDANKVVVFQNFIQEVILSLRAGESTEGFMNRMEDKGYQLIYSTPTSDRDFFVKVIDYLNEKAEMEYRTKFPSSSSRLILARKSEGFGFQDLKAVIDSKVVQWKNTDYERYLRPETLFASKKFESYIGQIKLNEKRQSPAGTGGKNTFNQFVGSVDEAKKRVKAIISKSSKPK